MTKKQSLLFFLLFALGTIKQTHAIIKKNTKQPNNLCRFYDLSKIKPADREPRSPIIQFYSFTDNIGNYLPVLGIRKMLNLTPDTWCMHHTNIDFNFINKNYACAIISGAGLLHKCFEPFWKKLRLCKIPMIMWGIGICLPDGKQGGRQGGIDKAIVSAVARQCDLINVRDQLTADYYKLDNASVSACPGILYLQDFRSHMTQKNNVLYSFHDKLVSRRMHTAIIAMLRKKVPRLEITSNIQTKSNGLETIIKNKYCTSNLVITSRLHGAIIAYSLGIPYIIIARDEKLRSFYHAYKNGLLVESIEELGIALENSNTIVMKPIEIEPVIEFGRQAREWVNRQITV